MVSNKTSREPDEETIREGVSRKQDEILVELRLIVDNLQQLNENTRSLLTYGIRQSK